ncbi:TOC75-3, chloroplastic [Olea europaea subsp. europaea]|uniref:TOC75-3, chloroplastic n=1 Tax=Olea europaea subsp. europaea TaxID=158383 RepID=A0A8S0UKP4_OLEEU|nr:TOC75-3, chloroplastic [Olea europaea subsp. europaea]
MNNNSKDQFHEHMVEMLETQEQHGQVACIVYDTLMHFVDEVATRLELPTVALRPNSAAYRQSDHVILQLQADNLIPLPGLANSDQPFLWRAEPAPGEGARPRVLALPERLAKKTHKNQSPEKQKSERAERKTLPPRHATAAACLLVSCDGGILEGVTLHFSSKFYFSGKNSLSSSPRHRNVFIRRFEFSVLGRWRKKTIWNEKNGIPMDCRSIINVEDAFNDLLTLQPCRIYTKAQLQKEVENLASSGWFKEVELDMKTNSDGTVDINFPIKEMYWGSKYRMKCIGVNSLLELDSIQMDENMTQNEAMESMMSYNRQYRKRVEEARPCMLPMAVQGEIQGMLRQCGNVNSRLLRKIAKRIEKWYHENGYQLSRVVNFGNLDPNSKELVCEVMEGDINRVVVQFQDKLGNICEGNTKLGVITRVLPKQLGKGRVFQIEAFREALNNLNSLNLFSNIELNPSMDERNGAITAEIKLQEAQCQSVEVSTEWNIVPQRSGRPMLASIQPSANISLEVRNLKGLNRSIIGSMTLSNLFDPEDDLGFKFEYVHPYLDGVHNPRNRTFRASCFNSSKSSPAFTSGPEVDLPPLWVDRAGVKANITEDFTKQSKFTCGLVMEEIITRDENGQISRNGQKMMLNGDISANGPPTTLSGTGTDRMAFLQANLTRDNTRSLNGALIGERNVFQFDQGLCIGSKFPFFNRHKLTMTKFFPLKQVEEGKGKPAPPVLVLHGLYGGCVGDLPNHEAFTLGGPYSVRGYNVGELGAARQKLELAAEVRIPVKNAYAYAFAEHGNDLGSSVSVQGNPTKAYMRNGHGSSYGVGVKLGQVRAEYAIDHNSRRGSLFIHVGERF